jgi:tetratricopeptide (TPR) repeat protein
MAKQNSVVYILFICLLPLSAAQAANHRYLAAKQPLARSSACLDAVEKAQLAHLPDLQLAPKLFDLADAYRREGATVEAIPVYEHALAICKKAHQSTSVRSLDGQLALADLYDDCGRYDKSAQTYSDALANAGQSELYQAEILPKLAAVTAKQGKLAQADALYKRAVSITEKHYGANDANVAEVLQEYAELLRKESKQAEANKVSVRARTIIEKKRQEQTAKPH